MVDMGMALWGHYRINGTFELGLVFQWRRVKWRRIFKGKLWDHKCTWENLG